MSRVAVVARADEARLGDALRVGAEVGLDPVAVTDRPALWGNPTWSDVDVLGPVDGVLALGDAGVAPAAELAARAGVEAVSTEVAARCRSKAAQRAAWADAGLRQPAWRVLSVGEPPPRGWIVKPVAAGGGRGVAIAEPGREERVAQLARWLDPAGECLCEEVVGGVEWAVDGVIVGGRLRAPRAARQERTPTSLRMTWSPGPIDPGVRSTVETMAAALGVITGPVHAEVIVGADGHVPIELHPRIVGGPCGAALGSADPLRAALLAAGGRVDEAEAAAADATHVAHMCLPAQAGVLEGIDGLDDARAVPGLIDVVPGHLGERIDPLPVGGQAWATVLAIGVDSPIDTACALLRPRLRHA